MVQRGFNALSERGGRFRKWRAAASLFALAIGQQALAQAPTEQTAPTIALAPPAEQTIAGTKINSTGRQIDLLVPLRDRFPLGQVAIRISPDDLVRVSVADIATALGRVATPEFIGRLKAIPAPDGFVALAELREAGLTIDFNPNELELVSDLAATSRTTSRISLGFQNEAFPPERDESESFSIYAAYRAAVDWEHRGSDEGLQSPRVDINLNGRLLRALSFENELSFDGEAERTFVRAASRLIYDRPDWAVRLTAGDQLPYSVSFQDAAEIFGLGIGRLLNTFRADRVVTASSGRTITLREPATVTVVVNGVPSRTLQLDAGVYDLSDLPLTAGANAVQLVVEDAAGGRRVVSFDFFQDYELLAPGVDEFNVHLGIRSRFLDGYRRYFKDEPAVSGFYRRGITPQLTLGVNAQATKAAQQLGLEATLGTPVGLFTLESAFSQIDGVGSGHALRLQYRYSTPLQQLQGARRVDVQIEQRSRSFGSIENVLPINDIKWRLSGRYSQPISDVLDAGLGVDFNDSRTAGRDSYAVRGTIGWQFRPDATVNLFGGYEKREGFNFGLNLLMRLGRNSIATAQYESASNQGALTYTHSPERLLDTLAYSAQLTRTRDNVGVNALASYRTNRGDFEVTHRASYGTRANEIVSQVTSLRYQGSVAFTGGRFAVGRFLYDSFAIVSAHPSLKGAPVLVGNRDADYVEARTGALGPALVSLSSYSRRNIFFDVPDAPQGYDLGAGNFQVYPWYHSGFELTVGSEFNVTVVGTLVDERGDPVALTSGIARRVNDPNSPAVAIYTNRSGKLGASGLAPGRWRISAGGLAYEMVIEEAQGTFVNLQTLRPTGRQENSR